MRKLSRAIPLVAAALLLWPILCAAATVRTLDGKVYDGDVKFDAGQLLVSPKGKEAVKIDLPNLLSLSYKVEVKPSVRPTSEPSAPAAPGGLPAPWQAKDIDIHAPREGSFRFVGDQYRITSWGASLHERSDVFSFVSQPFSGDATLVVRLKEITSNGGNARVGLMIREKLDPASRNTALLTTNRGLALQQRSVSPGPTAMVQHTPGAEPPLWLKLTRQGKSIEAFKSMDGSRWVPCGQCTFDVPEQVYWGLAVAAKSADQSCLAIFDNLSLSAGVFGELASGPVVAGKSLVMRNGAVISITGVLRIDARGVQFKAADGTIAVAPLDTVARVVFMPLTALMLAKIPDRGTGVLLGRGDFVEGDVQGYDGATVNISSVLFGLSKFAASTEAVAVVLAPVNPSRSMYVIQTRTGSTYMGKSVRLEGDAMIVEDESLGTVHVARNDLLDFRAGTGRFGRLVEMKPDKVEPGGSAYSINPPPGPGATLDGSPCSDGVVMMSGTALTWNLDGQYRVFLCRAGTPDSTVPTSGVRLVVTGDGKELFRSAPRTCLDEATNLALNVTGVRTLTLKAEPASPPGPLNLTSDLPAMVLWGEPALAK